MARGFNTTFGIGTSDVVKPNYTAAPIANKLLSWSVWYYKNSTGGGGLAKLLVQNASGAENGITCNSSNTSMKLLINGANNAIWTDKGLGVWQHLCVTVDATSSANTGLPYVNGVLTTATGNAGGILQLATGTSYIGNNSLNTTRTWDGMVAHAAYWNGVILTAGDALALACGASPNMMHPENLAYYLPLDGVNNPEFDFIRGASSSITGTAFGSSDPPIQPITRIRRLFDYETDKISAGGVTTVGFPGFAGGGITGTTGSGTVGLASCG